MLLTVNNGSLRGYWYQDGYIRTSSSLWTLDSINDTFAHLTNDAIQKHSSSYGKFEPGNKLTYSELQRYLDNLKTGRMCNFQSEIYPLLKEIATDAVRATSVSINPLRNCSNFEIFGFDFMIDANFKPWLIEINTNPCLEMSCAVLERIIPSMVENAFRYLSF
jgi:D-alanine-D-alanine ligase-like ATP-grasp enzyme